MIICAASDKTETTRYQRFRQRAGVMNHLLAVEFEFRRGRFLQSRGNSGGLVIVRAALKAGNDSAIHQFSQIFFALGMVNIMPAVGHSRYQNHGAARTA